MEPQSLLLTILTSAVVSGTVTFLLKTYFKYRIEYYYKIELEKYKHELTIKLNESADASLRRSEIHPKIVELVYRLRNMSRDLVDITLKNNISIIDELHARIDELKDYLYAHRIDLEKDSLFSEIHSYKNMLTEYYRKVSDVKYCLERNENENATHLKQELQEAYQIIETSHLKIITSISKPD